jgi:uncharacterized FlaG/YvyC family protein
MTKKKEIENEHVRKSFESYSCKYEFSGEELADKTEEIARKLEERERKEEAKKEITAQYKAEIDTLKNEISLLGTHLRNRYEFRQIRCEVQRDFEKGTVKVYRTDTGELVRERAMSVSERQTELDLNTKEIPVHTDPEEEEEDDGRR